MWAVSAIAVLAKPLTQMGKALVFSRTEHTSTGQTASASFNQRWTIITAHPRKPFATSDETIFLPQRETSVAQTTGSSFGTLITINAFAEPKAAETGAYIWPFKHHHATSSGTARAWLWGGDACCAVGARPHPFALKLEAGRGIGNDASCSSEFFC